MRVVSNSRRIDTMADRLHTLIQACRKGEEAAQRALYLEFYNYAMSVCLRYSNNRQEAEEIVNDGFVKVLTGLHKFDNNRSFRAWLRRIMINCSIDFYRRNEKHTHGLDIVHARDVGVAAEGLSRLTEAEILTLVQQLPPSYRAVFNLFVVEGYKHDEIAQRMNISVGTSKSHLAKARMKLKLLLNNIYQESSQHYG
ncbi:MAG: RNA polymerase sigma factor [Bacteroidota bacterium]